MLQFVPDHLKTKKIYEHTVKKLPFVIKYVPDHYKSKEMCGKVILEYGGIIGFTPDCYKDQKGVIRLLIIILMH